MKAKANESAESHCRRLGAHHKVKVAAPKAAA